MTTRSIASRVTHPACEGCIHLADQCDERDDYYGEEITSFRPCNYYKSIAYQHSRPTGCHSREVSRVYKARYVENARGVVIDMSKPIAEDTRNFRGPNGKFVGCEIEAGQ